MIGLAAYSAAEEESKAVAKKHYLIKLLGTREGWPEEMTDDERRVMGEHYIYLKELTERGTCILAGPVFGEFGLVALEVNDEAEARAIMDREPSVVQGVHTYEITEMVASLVTNPFQRHVGRSDRVLVHEVEVNAPVDRVWHAWTTNDGAKAFFSPNVNIDLRVGGPYEIYFDMTQEPGMRGAEGCHVLSFLPKRMLSFEWNAPPAIPALREADVKTVCVVEFDSLDENTTKITHSQLGFGEGEDWDAYWDYFDKAWGYVLENCRKSFEE